MKKLFFAAAVAALAMTANAKTADELRVYINPGHGSWTANDRPIPVLGHEPYNRYGTDTTSFFESNTNLRKGFGVLEKLRTYGLKFDETLNQTGERHQIGAARDMSNNIVMSHVKCGPYHDDNGTKNQLGDKAPVDLEYYNRNLTEICVEVDANNFDLFISIHSNALTGPWLTTNYPLIIYRGYDDVEKTDDGIDNNHSRESRKFAETVWPHHFNCAHEPWTSYKTSMNVRGDLNFYGSGSVSRGYKGYLGVLKHGTVGFLVEGYFHDYGPSALRHMNWDVDYVEGYEYAHGIADYLGLQKESTGDIYGIVRDSKEIFDDPNWVPQGDTKDIYRPVNDAKVYLKKDGVVVDEYTTDKQYNGAFVFKGVEPGTYTIEVENPDFAPCTPVEVTVKAAEIAYPSIFIDNYSLMAPEGEFTDYPDEVAGLVVAPESYTFVATEGSVPELAGKTIKRMIAHGNYLYILAEGAAGMGTEAIYVVDGRSLELVATPDLGPAEGTDRAISDIQVTADGVLIACNLEVCHFDDKQVASGESRGQAKVYRWSKDENGLPRDEAKLWISTQKSGNFTRAYVGHGMSYTGTLYNGTCVLTAMTAGGTTKNMFLNVMTVKEAMKDKDDIRNNNEPAKAGFNGVALGDNFTMVASPFDPMNYITNSPLQGVREYTYGVGGKDNVTVAEMAEGVIPTEAAGTSFLRYAGKVYMVSPAVADGKAAGVQLVDVTEGIAKAALVSTEGLTTEAAEGDYAAAGAAKLSHDADGNAVAGDMQLYLLAGEKLVRFSTDPTDGLQSIAIDNNNAPVEYFNLQGVRVANPTSGLYIRRQGNNVTKIMIK
ncbi:MAG: carboxypeptidase-like regulatory domain-containing protein [Muribaculaceae bacterium]|nr:carboxypeptidase-like regulatory domain-containing protein [Muribaculaceae bacterium]